MADFPMVGDWVLWSAVGLVVLYALMDAASRGKQHDDEAPVEKRPPQKHAPQEPETPGLGTGCPWGPPSEKR